MDEQERKKRDRILAGALLLSIRRTRRLLGTALDAATAGVALELTSSTGLAGAARVASRAAPHLETFLVGAIARGRALARDDARSRLSKDLRVVGVDFDQRSLRSDEGHLLDEGSAVVAGAALAASWRSNLLVLGTRAVRNGDAGTAIVTRVERRLSSSLDRTAETETSRAFSDERRSGTLLANRRSHERIERRWIAMLDACEDCRDHDDEISVNGEFSGGDEPGAMHPRCCCVDSPEVVG